MPVKIDRGIYSFVPNASDKAPTFATDETRQSLRTAAPNSLSSSIMDVSRADVWIVLDTELNLPLGSPTVTVGIDVATRMALSCLVSFELPSQSIEPVSEKAFGQRQSEAGRHDFWTTDDECETGLTDSRRTCFA